jgi:transcription antitermination factor NusG
MMMWFVLRTAGRTTLRLADSLAADGFTVWTPRETRKIRIPRANVRRDVVLPLMPSYVFAGSSHMIDLIEMQKGSQHASFSVMHWHDSIPLIADEHLNSLRMLERKRTPRKKAHKFAPGVEVRVKEEGGSFVGMCGRVEKSDELTTLVCFDRRMTVKIPTSLLQCNGIRNEVPSSGFIARAA